MSTTSKPFILPSGVPPGVGDIPRFTHRYWFHAVSNQTQAHDLFALCRSHLDIDWLYDDIRQEIQEMSEFLENEALRRQADTVTRLTVVTTFGLIGTTVTGFLGMNILAWAEEPLRGGSWHSWRFWCRRSF